MDISGVESAADITNIGGRVPEPGTIFLLSAGLTGLALFGRHENRFCSNPEFGRKRVFRVTQGGAANE